MVHQRGARITQLLRRVPWRSLGARAVVVYGSTLRGEREPRDVDLLVLVDRQLSLEEEAHIAEAVEEACGLEADLAVVTPENLDCHLLLIALEQGELVHVDDGEGLLARTIMQCYDFMLSKRKVHYTETLVKTVLGDATRKTRRDNS